VRAPDGKRYLRKWKIIGTNKDEDGENNQKVLSCHERAVHVEGPFLGVKRQLRDSGGTGKEALTTLTSHP